MQFKLFLFVALFAYAACDETEDASTDCTTETTTTQIPDDQMQITCNLCLGSPTSDCAKETQDSMVTQTCKPIHIHPHHGVHPHHHKHHRHHHHHHFSTTPIPTTTTGAPITINDAGNALPESSEDAPVTEESLEREQRDSEEHWKRHGKHAHFGKHHGKGHHNKVFYPQCIYLRTKGVNQTSALVTRGCGYSPDQKDVCKFIQHLNKDIVECKSCTTDKCN